jgi:hypothetical protein
LEVEEEGDEGDEDMVREVGFARQSALRAMIHAWCMADAVWKNGRPNVGVVPPGPAAKLRVGTCLGHVEIVV